MQDVARTAAELRQGACLVDHCKPCTSRRCSSLLIRPLMMDAGGGSSMRITPSSAPRYGQLEQRRVHRNGCLAFTLFGKIMLLTLNIKYF